MRSKLVKITGKGYFRINIMMINKMTNIEKEFKKKDSGIRLN